VNAPQIIVIALYATGLLWSVGHHGRRRTRIVDAWETLLATTILFLLLYWGGFWEAKA
jgi:hypothetical protein